MVDGDLLHAISVAARAYEGRTDRQGEPYVAHAMRVMLEVEGDRVKSVRLALGGVAHKPWRARKAEAALQGQTASEQNFRRAAEAELADATLLRDNGFKGELVARTIAAVLGNLAGGAS